MKHPVAYHTFVQERQVWHNFQRGYPYMGRSHRWPHACTISENKCVPLTCLLLPDFFFGSSIVDVLFVNLEFPRLLICNYAYSIYIYNYIYIYCTHAYLHTAGEPASLSWLAGSRPPNPKCQIPAIKTSSFYDLLWSLYFYILHNGHWFFFYPTFIA
jgi:hypothetical protein